MYLSMPVESCSLDGKSGFRYGKEGKCYTYTSGDESSKQEARKKANAQGIAMRATGYIAKQNVVSSGTMGSGIKNPQQGYGKKKKKKNKVIEDIKKNLDTWFRERWVDISRPKKGGGYEQCGRRDASTGKYPKCVPASRAARMSESQRRSAVQRKRRAESTQQRKDKKPINVSTEKMEKRNVPTNPSLYARVKAAAKAKFDVYPSAYANAWLVREYKKRGGGYRVVNKVADDLDEQEALLADMLIALTEKFGKFNEDEIGVWAGYDSPEENDVADIGVKCSNCVLYQGEGLCKIISQAVEPEGKCRFAIIPDGVVDEDDISEDD